MKTWSILYNGIWKENPTFRLLLGMCPTLAISTQAVNGIGMGLAATFVLIFSNVFVSALQNFIPSKVRIPAYVIVIATFVTMVDMIMEAFVPALYDALGIYIPLIVVNCIILARAEAFAGKNGVWLSAMDGLGMGLGFTLALTVFAAVRELLGAGSLFGIPVLGAGYEPVIMALLAPGGFLLLGLLLGAINWLGSAKAPQSQGKEDTCHDLSCAACTHSCGMRSGQ